jgi:hypothetical protein
LKKPITKRGWWSGFKVEALSSKPNTEKKKKKKNKYPSQKRAGRVACLPSKCEALSTNSSTAKTEKRPKSQMTIF